MIYKKIDTHCAIFCNVSEEVAQEYIDYRIMKKKPLTQGAFNRAMNQANKCNCPPDVAIEITIDKGWDGVTPEYIAVELSRRFEAVAQVATKIIRTIPQRSLQNDTRSTTLAQDLNDKSWAN